jgi:transposase
MAMDVLVDVCAALDVHKDQVTACVRRWSATGKRRDSEVRTFSTMLADLGVLRRWLESEAVTVVGMEATGVYWKPVWYELEDSGRFELKLLNPTHVKAVSGRKTDVRDAKWLARLVECELVDGSFVPPREIRELRDVTRYRRRITEERARELQRLQKLLEDAQVKLDSVVSDINGLSARLILQALCDGERDPDVLADLAQRSLRRKIPQLRQAVPGRFNQHHALLVRELLAHIDYLTATEARLDARVDELIAPFSWARELLVTIPGVQARSAEIIIAEIGVDMSCFPSAAHLASWAGMCPGNNESGGKRRSGKTTKGNPWLRAALVEAAHAAGRTRNTYLSAQYRRLASRRGKKRAAVAVGHSILVIAYHLLERSCGYEELGGDYFDKCDRQGVERRLVRRLEGLGYKVSLDPVAA